MTDVELMQMIGMMHPACDIAYLLYIATNRAFRYSKRTDGIKGSEAGQTKLTSRYNS
jgi:hypothetical protein